MLNKLLYLCLVLPIFTSSCRSTSGSAISENTATLSEMNIQKITCKAILTNGNDLVITRSISELPFASYHVDIDGGNIILGDAPSVRQTDDSFMVQKIIDIGQRQDIEVSAGINRINGEFEGFYMEAANGGLSPLPGISFKPCVIEEVSLDNGLGSATGDGNCRADNVMVLNGNSVDSSDGCNSCSCNDGGFACTEIACGNMEYNGCVVGPVGIPNGESIDSSDGCNSCTCTNGSLACTEAFCG